MHEHRQRRLGQRLADRVRRAGLLRQVTGGQAQERGFDTNTWMTSAPMSAA